MNVCYYLLPTIPASVLMMCTLTSLCFACTIVFCLIKSQYRDSIRVPEFLSENCFLNV